jgi:poly(A) polymerase
MREPDAIRTLVEADPIVLLELAAAIADGGRVPGDRVTELAHEHAGRLLEADKGRLRTAVEQMLVGTQIDIALEWVHASGILRVLFPELEATVDLVQETGRQHKDVWAHTKQVVKQTVRRPLVRWAALLHDIGKPGTRTERDGWVSFLGHDATGAELVTALCGRLRTSRRLASHLAAMTRDHLVLGFMVRERPLPPRRVWDYLSRTSPQSVDTTLLTVADRLSAQGGGVPEEAITGHLELAREMLAAAVDWEREGPPEPLLRGDDIAAEAGIAVGPALGEAVLELEAAQYTGEVTDRDAAVAHLRAWAAGR